MPIVKVDQLDAKRAEWKLYAEAWNHFDVLHAGGVRLKRMAQEFLTKRPKELFDVYNERIKRITYQNILGTSLGWYAATLFRRNPEIEIKPDGSAKWYADEFLKNCNRAGKGYVDFWRDGFLNLMLYRSTYVLVDAPKAAQAPASRADESEQELDKPYVVMFDPRQVINQSVDEYGNLNWVVLKTLRETSVFLEEPKIETLWYYFDRRNYQVYKSVDKPKTTPTDGGNLTMPTISEPTEAELEAELIDEGQHALAKVNRVPVRIVEIPDALWLANRVYMQITEHLNTENSLAWGLFNANLAMPVVYHDGDMANLTMSETAYLQLNQGDKFEWAEPEGRSFELSLRKLGSLREEIYRSMYLSAQGKSSSASASSQSGFSKEMDMMPANDALNGFGDIMRQGMQDVLMDVAAARGESAVTFDVRGFRFETKPATESIALNEEAQGLGIPSKTLEKEIDKRTALDLLEDANDDLKKTVVDEIEAAPSRAEAQQAAQTQQAQSFQKSFQTLSNRVAVRAELGAIGEQAGGGQT